MGGLPLDRCREYGANCGLPAALLFCQMKGAEDAAAGAWCTLAAAGNGPWRHAGQPEAVWDAWRSGHEGNCSLQR